MSEYHLNLDGKLREEDYTIIEEYLDIIEHDDLLIVNPDMDNGTDIDRIIKMMEVNGFCTKLSKNKKSGGDCILAARA